MMDINNLMGLVALPSNGCCLLTLAWFASSKVKERRLTSGMLTEPNVTPELTYLTKALLTIT